MAEEKKTITLLNKGKRRYDTGRVGKKGERILLVPGGLLEFSAEEAAKLAQYKDLVDVSKLPGTVDTSALKSDNAKLADENEKLKAQIKALEAKEPEPKKDKADDEAETEKESAAKGKGKDDKKAK